LRPDDEADILALVQILFSYPPDKPVSPEVVSFCFPHDVQPSLLERTPSMSALNELIYSQQYQHDDAVSFVFLLKVSHDGLVTHYHRHNGVHAVNDNYCTQTIGAASGRSSELFSRTLNRQHLEAKFYY